MVGRARHNDIQGLDIFARTCLNNIPELTGRIEGSTSFDRPVFDSAVLLWEGG
jgi:hypothetical protein